MGEGGEGEGEEEGDRALGEENVCECLGEGDGGGAELVEEFACGM